MRLTAKIPPLAPLGRDDSGLFIGRDDSGLFIGRDDSGLFIGRDDSGLTHLSFRV